MTSQYKRRATDRKLRHQPVFWFSIALIVVLIMVLVTVTLSAIAAGRADKAIAREKDLRATAALHRQARDQQIRDIICGVYIPIANAPLTAETTELGRTVSAATRKAATELKCPGLQPIALATIPPSN